MKISIHPHRAARFEVETDAGTVECKTEDLMSEARFAKAHLNHTDRFWHPVGQAAFVKMVEQALARAKRSTTVSKETMVVAHLWDFVHFNRIDKGEDDAQVHTGAVLWMPDKVCAMFKFDFFMAHIRRRSTANITASDVTEILIRTKIGWVRTNTHIASRQIRPFEVNLVQLEKVYRGN
jgi:hypothetical protein